MSSEYWLRPETLQWGWRDGQAGPLWTQLSRVTIRPGVGFCSDMASQPPLLLDVNPVNSPVR